MEIRENHPLTELPAKLYWFGGTVYEVGAGHQAHRCEDVNPRPQCGGLCTRRPQAPWHSYLHHPDPCHSPAASSDAWEDT